MPDDVKNERLRRMIAKFREIATLENQRFVASHQTILIEGVCLFVFTKIFKWFYLNLTLQTSKRSAEHVFGRNDANIKVIIPSRYTMRNGEVLDCLPGDFVRVRIDESNSQVLKGTPLAHTRL